MLDDDNKMSANRLQSMVEGLGLRRRPMKASNLFGIDINQITFARSG
jgi:hypothetical protein